MSEQILCLIAAGLIVYILYIGLRKQSMNKCNMQQEDEYQYYDDPNDHASYCPMRYRNNREGFSHNNIKVYWFHRPGCPHCDNMKNDWYNIDGLPDNYHLISIDTSKPENAQLAAQYKVNGVPHIVLVNEANNVYVYKGDRSTDDMTKWILNPH